MKKKFCIVVVEYTVILVEYTTVTLITSNFNNKIFKYKLNLISLWIRPCNQHRRIRSPSQIPAVLPDSTSITISVVVTASWSPPPSSANASATD